MPTSDGKVRILAISGGGIRGIIPAVVLARIEKLTGKPIHQSFDLVCGTSTGGIIAAGLTMAKPLSGDQILDLYLNHGRTIFSQSFWRKIRSLGKNLGPKFDGVGLASVLLGAFGDIKLEDALIPTFMPAYAIERRSPVFFRSWVPSAKPHTLVDVCMATSAGPTYFPPACVNGDWYWDGGVINNNPALSGVIKACMRFGVHTRDCLVVSLGTGVNQAPIPHEKAMGWGNLGVVQPLLDVCLDGVSDLTHYQLCDLLPDKNYLALQTQLSEQNAEMDNVNPHNFADLIVKARELVDSNSGRLAEFCERLQG